MGRNDVAELLWFQICKISWNYVYFDKYGHQMFENSCSNYIFRAFLAFTSITVHLQLIWRQDEKCSTHSHSHHSVSLKRPCPMWFCSVSKLSCESISLPHFHFHDRFFRACKRDFFSASGIKDMNHLTLLPVLQVKDFPNIDFYFLNHIWFYYTESIDVV
jgi:hypothetical protein